MSLSYGFRLIQHPLWPYNLINILIPWVSQVKIIKNLSIIHNLTSAIILELQTFTNKLLLYLKVYEIHVLRNQLGLCLVDELCCVGVYSGKGWFGLCLGDVLFWGNNALVKPDQFLDLLAVLPFVTVVLQGGEYLQRVRKQRWLIILTANHHNGMSVQLR